METLFPQLVATDKDGFKSVYYSQITPVLTEAIKELNVKVQGLSSLDTTNANSLGSLVSQFLGDITNGIQVVFFGEVHTKKLCLEDVCSTKDDLQRIINNSNGGNSGGSGGGTPPPGDTTPPPGDTNPPAPTCDAPSTLVDGVCTPPTTDNPPAGDTTPPPDTTPVS